MHPAIVLVLNRLRSALGTGETPPGSNWNFIVQWYNDVVERIGRGPWCQMTVTWSHFTVLPKKLIKGRAYTVWAAQDFQAGFEGGTWHWGTGGMRAGDVVYYDWDLPRTNVRSAERVDHVGTVERIIGNGTFAVLEGNNSANRLDRMIRNSRFVVGYGRPDWSRSGVQAPPPASAKPCLPKPKPRRPKLVVDGDLGPATIREWQIINGTPVDGVISPVSSLVAAVQRFLNTRGAKLKVDGQGLGSNSRRDYGPTNTVRALQRYYGTPVDGVLSKGDSSLVRAIQTAINRQNGY